MQARALVFGSRGDDFYRVGRTLRSLEAAGVEGKDVGEWTGEKLREASSPRPPTPSDGGEGETFTAQEVLRHGGPLLLLRAGTWLVRAEGFGFPRSSATNRGLCALGGVRIPERGNAAAEYVGAWGELLAKTGGDFSRVQGSQPDLPEPCAMYLDATAVRSLVGEKELSPAAILRFALGNLRVVHFSPLDVFDDDGLRVLQVIPSLQRGGAERLTLDLVAELPAHQVRARLVTLGRSLREAFVAPPGALELAGLRNAEARRAELVRQVRAFGADLIHGHLLTVDDALHIAAHKIPLVITVHNTRHGWPAGLSELREDEVTLLAACSQAVEKDLKEAGIPVPVRTARNGIDLRAFKLNPERQAAGRRWRQVWGFGENDLVLAAVANPRAQKRLHRLPEVLAAVRAKLSLGREVRLVLCGEAKAWNAEAGACLREIEVEIARLGLEAHVRWTGSVTEVAGLLAAVDVLVSTSAHEGLSLAQLEALAMGCGAVATDAGGEREIARDNPNMRVLPREASAEQFAEAILGCCNSKHAAQLHGDWSREQMAARYRWLYLRVIAAANRTRRYVFSVAGSSAMGKNRDRPHGASDEFNACSALQLAAARLRHSRALGLELNTYPRRGRGIWLITNNFSTGGAQSSARRLLAGLAAQGIPVRAAVVEEHPDNPTPGRRELNEAGIKVLAVPPVGAENASAAAEQLLAAIDADSPEAVVFWNLRPVYKVMLADALLDVSVFDVSPGEMFFESWEKYFAKPQAGLPYHSPREYGARLAGAIVKYRAEAQRAAEVLGAPVHVVPNGVPIVEACDHSSITASSISQSLVTSTTTNGLNLRRAGETVVFGTAARISRRKRLEDLLEAFRLVNGQLPPWTLKIAGGVECGSEEYAAQLRELAAGLPVEWVGETQEVAAFHRELDVFVMISEPAGCPNASLEAMASGLPVVATDFGGVSEQVVDGETGRLVPARDPRAFAAAVVEVGGDSKLRERMGNAARKRVRECFSLERMIGEYRRIFGLGRPSLRD